MKTSTHSLFLAACALGIAAFALKALAADTTPTPACNMPSCAMQSQSCCPGMSTTEVADTNTNSVADQMTTCPVSGEKLNGDMGAPYIFTYKGQEVKLCCHSCKKDFDKDPEKYIKIIRAADKK